MYMGKAVEEADVDAIFFDPKHPYTQALLESIPRLGHLTRDRRRLEPIRGTVPDPYALPQRVLLSSALRSGHSRGVRCGDAALYPAQSGARRPLSPLCQVAFGHAWTRTGENFPVLAIDKTA